MTDLRAEATRIGYWDEGIANYRILDDRTNKPVTVASYPTRDLAEKQIADWQHRHNQGGRRMIACHIDDNYDYDYEADLREADTIAQSLIRRGIITPAREDAHIDDCD